MRSWILVAAIFVAYALAGCTQNNAPLGSADNPVKLFFVPSVDAKVIESNSKIFKDFLEKNTPYKFKVAVPQSFIAVVEAFGTERADVALINSYGYYKAHSKYGAEARITVLRHGSSTYQSQFIARADGPVKSLKDLDGKKVAFVDPSSASGYLLPMKTLKEKKIQPKETVFAMKHDSVVSMIYQGQVDAGATFYSPPAEGKMDDARRLVLTQYPDVEKKVKIVELSDPIPNDPIVFRKNMPDEVKAKITDAFLAFVATDEGRAAFKAIYGVDELKKATDADYEAVRTMFSSLNIDDKDMTKN
jgi:phosphonate transport system substrate-binding protein